MVSTFFFSYSFGGWEVQDQGSRQFSFWWGPSSWLADDHLYTHRAEGPEALVSLLIRALIGIIRAPPSWPHLNLITSQRLYILTPSHWGFSSVQFSCSVTSRLFATPWTAALQASLSITNSQSLLRLMSIESEMPSSSGGKKGWNSGQITENFLYLSRLKKCVHSYWIHGMITDVVL